MADKIIAIKDGKVSEFTVHQWGLMPAHKYGWKIHVPEAEVKTEKAEDAKEETEESSNGSPSSSSDLTVKDATATIKKIESIEEVQSFVEGDERSGVEKAATKRIEELS